MRKPAGGQRPEVSQTVLAYLEADEPDYDRAKDRLRPSAVEELALVIEGDDPLLASKAIYLASLLDQESFLPLAERAREREDPTIRVAVAAAARNLSPKPAAKLLAGLLGDPDLGVRKTALNSVDKRSARYLQDEIKRLLDMEKSDYLRKLARERLQ